MNTLHLSKLAFFARDALCGLGILYFSQLMGWVNFTVQSLEISPSQAHAVQNQLEYTTDAPA